MKRLHVLALASYPERAASSRFRILAYTPLLSQLGIDLTLSSTLDDDAFSRFYAPGMRLRKGLDALGGMSRQLRAAVRKADVVLVQREATLVGPPILEAFVGLIQKRPIIYDFDDAVWEPTHQYSRHPLLYRWLKAPDKTWTIMKLARHILAGSRYLAEVASSRNPHVTVLRTVVSRDRWRPLPGRLDGKLVGDPPTIGWIGTHTTAETLRVVAPALRKLREAGLPFRVRIIGSGPGFEMPGVPCDVRPWRAQHEIEDFQQLDIGIAPLLPISFSRGKCAFKQVQYMATGVPSVSTPDGAATEIITHGHNGLLATTEEEWFAGLRSLLLDPSLRARLATNGRNLIENHLCTEAQAPTLAAVLRAAAG